MRYPSIDLMRTIAIFIMVVVHFGENLSGVTVPVAGMGAPQFIFLSGVSYFLWSRGRKARGTSESELSKISVRRGLFVFCVGIAFNVFVWLPEDTFNWDVLTFIGSALLVLGVVRHLPSAILLAMAITAALVSPVLREIVAYEEYWPNKYYEYDFVLSEVVTGYFVAGYFPIFPWIAFSLIGYVAARYLLEEPSAEEFRAQEPGTEEPVPSIGPIVGIGAVLLATSIGLQLIGRWGGDAIAAQPVAAKLLNGWRMFPPSLAYMLGMLGATLLLFATMHQWLDRSPARIERWKSLLKVCQTFSQYSFTIYIVHHVAHLYPLWIYGALYGEETTIFWGNALPLSASLTLAALFLVVTFWLLRQLGEKRSFGIESAMRWLCD